MKLNAIALLLAAALFLTGADPGQPWNHNPKDPKLGPAAWAAVDTAYANCAADVGRKQSPVNIVTSQTTRATFDPLVFTENGRTLTLQNTDHVLEVEYAGGATLKAGSQPTDSYVLQQWHLHVPSEHRIDGKEYSAELHLVYRNSIGELSVVGVFMDEKLPPKANLDPVIRNFPRRKGSVPFTSGAPSVMSLLPANRTFYRYEGSLTTPPCSESVKWFVMANPVGITPANLGTLHSLVSAFTDYHGYPDNNRPPVALNGRKILKSLP